MLCFIYTKSQTKPHNIFVYSSCRSYCQRYEWTKKHSYFYFKQKKSWQWNEWLHWLRVDWSVYSHQSDFTSSQFHSLSDVFDEKKFEHFISISSLDHGSRKIHIFEIVCWYDQKNFWMKWKSCKRFITKNYSILNLLNRKRIRWSNRWSIVYESETNDW